MYHRSITCQCLCVTTNESNGRLAWKCKFTWVSTINCHKYGLKKCLCVAAQGNQVTSQDLQEGRAGCQLHFCLGDM